jgi:hypothetical protein
MKILVACEYSGAVRDEFIALGHEAMSCDLIPSDKPGPHYEGDLFDVIDNGWDMMIAFPPCTHLAVSGARHFAAKRADGRQQEGIDFFMRCANAGIERIAIENPVGIMSNIWRKPDQIIQPWQFGDKAQKTTCLWLKNLPLLTHTEIVDKGDFYIAPSGKKLPAWYGDTVVNGKKIGWNTPELKKIRSKTFQGIANAMAQQWGAHNGH